MTRCELCRKQFQPQAERANRFCSRECRRQFAIQRAEPRDCDCGLTTFAKIDELWLAIVDAQDGHLLKDYKWFFGGSSHYSVFYAQSQYYGRQNQTSDKLHIAVMGKGPWDHANGWGSDCRKANLRPGPPHKNIRNTKRRWDSQSGYKGVRDRGFGLIAYISIDGKQKSLGMFQNPEQAAIAYNYHAADLFGEFARLNRLPPGIGWDGLQMSSQHD